MKNSISLRFITIVLLLTFVLFTILALITITLFKNTLSEQADSFIAVLKDEQQNEEELLRGALLRKGESILKLLAHNGSMLIVSYEFDSLKQLAENGALDRKLCM